MTRTRTAAPDDISTVRRDIEHRLRALGSPEHARTLQRFFKTGPGEYGAGDIFLGLRVPEVRRLAAHYRALSLDEIAELLASPYHEARLLALVLMVDRFRARGPADQADVYRRYLENTDRINNWDLVDVSAPHIVGAHLIDRARAPLFRLARSASVWDRRIAIMATLAFIRAGDFSDTLKLARLLRDDPHDLIHKAVGWMLREVGKRDRPAAEAFLIENHRRMPRTMLRYAIEHLPPQRRRAYLEGTIAS